MPSVTCTTIVQAPVERVFEVFTDLRNAADRISGITKIEVLTEGPIGLGTKFRETRVMFGKESSETMEITAFDAPRSYTVEARSCGAHYRSVLTFTPQGGGTQAEMTFHATAESFTAKLMSPLSGMMLKACKKAMGKDFAELKAHVEAKA